MNAGEIQVRKARVADASEVVRLLTQLGHAQPPGSDSDRLVAFIEQGQWVFVAERQPAAQMPHLLGVATLHVMPVMHRAGPIGRLTAVVVDEPARGEGVGRALVRAGEEFLAARGCAMIEITSNIKRADAHAFYERLGYERTSFRFAKKVTSLAPPA